MLRLVGFLLIVTLVAACVPYTSNTLYEVNMKFVEKGVATGSAPKGMKSGDLWARGVDGGYIRLKTQSALDRVQLDSFYVVRFTHDGLGVSIIPSLIDSNFVISR